jgi:circadian clock protein KaiC
MLQRMPTGITGLDEMLNGGFVAHTAVLVEGAPGTGKTTLGMHFIMHGCLALDQPGVILTFEEFPQQYYRDAASFGWDFKQLEADNKLRVVMSSPEVTRADVRQVGGLLERHVEDIGAQRILVDSISHFERITRDRVELRDTVFEFVNGLKRLGLTVVLTRESAALLGSDSMLDQDIAFLTDGYLLMRYVEIDSEIQKALLVLKLRGSDHARDIRQYEITGQGLVVQSRFQGQYGIMSGNPTPRMAEAFGEAFGRPDQRQGR